MRITHAIFDLDGTLTDSMEIWDHIADDYLRSVGVEPPNGLAQTLGAMRLYDACDYLRVQFSLPWNTKAVMEAVNGMVGAQYRETVPLKEGVAKLLSLLAGRGVKMCVATASDRAMTEAALGRLGVLRYFSFILTCTELGCGKDNPLIYTLAAEKLGAAPREVTVFEDAWHGIQTAKAAGFQVVGVYDRSARHHEAKIKEACDRYYLSLADLVEELKREG